MSRGMYNAAHFFNTTDDDGKPIQMAYLVGQLSRDIPFLTRTKKGTVMLPWFIDSDGSTTMANESSGYVLKNGSLESFDLPKKPEQFSKHDLKLISVAVNLENKVTFYPIFAMGNEAMRLHKSMSKGDTVIVLGKLVQTSISGFETRDVVWIKDCRLLRQSNKKNLTEATDPDDRDSIGF